MEGGYLRHEYKMWAAEIHIPVNNRNVPSPKSTNPNVNGSGPLSNQVPLWVPYVN